MIAPAGTAVPPALGRRLAALRLLVLLAACLTRSEAAHAHDPFEITTAGRVHAERLDLVVTMTLPQGAKSTRLASLLIAALGAYWFFDRTLKG